MNINIKKSQYNTFFIVALITILLITIDFLALQISHKLFLLVSLGIAGSVFLISGLYPSLLWLLISFIFIMFPSENISYRYTIMPLLPNPLITAFNLFLIAITFLRFYFHPDKIKQMTNTEKLVIIFLLYGLFSASIGIFHGYEIKGILRELGFISGYAAFLATYNSAFFYKKKEYLFVPLAAIFFLLSFEYILTAKYVVATFISSHRVYSRQIASGIVAFPLFYSMILWGKDKKEFLWGILLSASFFFVTILSFQRTFWLAAIITFFFVSIIGFFFSTTNKRKAIISLLVILGTLILLLTLTIIVLTTYVDVDYMNSLQKRWNTIQSFDRVSKEESFIVRKSDLDNLIKDKFINSNILDLLIGKGLGDRAHRTYPNSQYMLFIDNSYAVLLWKLGLLGTLLFFLMIINVVMKTINIIKNTKDNAMAIGLLSTIFMLLLYMFGTNISMSYRFITFIWGMIGYILGYYKNEEVL